MGVRGVLSNISRIISLFRNDVIFQHKEFSLMREELMTIAPDTYISAAVIDVWCTITNKNEQFRAPHSPCRYFATTDVCVSV